MDVEQLLTWRCVRQRHGVTAHVAVIIGGSALKAALPDFMMRQAKLIPLKLAIVPMLFHGAPFPLPPLQRLPGMALTQCIVVCRQFSAGAAGNLWGCVAHQQVQVRVAAVSTAC